MIAIDDCKDIQPMAAGTDDAGYHQLHHFITSGTWDAAKLESRLVIEADQLVGDAKGYLSIDDMAQLNKGCNSVGVAPQYALSRDRTVNCQPLVSVMVGPRPFLPESWTDDPTRMKRI